MMFKCLWLILTIDNVVILAHGQYGGYGVGSSCGNNMNCGFNSICQNQRCACPYNYNQIGSGCMNGGYGGGGFGGGFGGIGGFGGMGGFGGGCGGSYINPGMSCGGFGGGGFGGGGGCCGGGSSCNSGMCSCPQNFVQSGGSCVQLSIVYPGQSCNQFQQCGGGSFCQNNVCCCPQGYMSSGSGCNQGGFGGGFGGGYGGGFGGGYGGGFGGNGGGGSITIIITPGQACGGNSGGNCGGGSSCNQGYCTCPPNCIVQNNQCTPYGNGGGSFGGGGFGGLGGFGGGFNNYMSYVPNIGLGGYCNQQTSCGYGGQCMNNVCQCGSGYYSQGGGCFRKKFMREDPTKKSDKPKLNVDEKKL